MHLLARRRDAEQRAAGCAAGDGLPLSFSPLQALRYTGSHAKVHAPSLVASEILNKDGSVTQRFGLACGAALPTNTSKRFPPKRAEMGPPRARSPGAAAPQESGIQTAGVLSVL